MTVNNNKTTQSHKRWHPVKNIFFPCYLVTLLPCHPYLCRTRVIQTEKRLQTDRELIKSDGVTDVAANVVTIILHHFITYLPPPFCPISQILLQKV